MTTVRICSKCGTPKEDGRRCRPCVKVASALWHQENKVKAIARNRAWAVAHPERMREYKTRHASKPETKSSKAARNRRYLQARKLWAEKNLDKVNVYRRKYRTNAIAELSCWYIKNLAEQQIGTRDVPRDWIGAKRAYLRVIRVLRVLASCNFRELEIRQTDDLIGDLNREIKNADYMRRGARDISGSDDRAKSTEN